MFHHFFKIVVRQFATSMMYMLIKVLGLAIGLAVSLLIMLYVMHELSYDSFHKNRELIYNLVVTMRNGDVSETVAQATAGMGESLVREFPEIENVVRFSQPNDVFFVVDGKTKVLKDVVFADSSVFEVFSFPMVSGNPDFALKEPFTMVITESGAENLFGDENPLGKVLRYNGKYNFRITGIVKDPPTNSHIFFGAIMSFASLYSMEGYHLDWDGGWGYYTYVQVAKNMNWPQFSAKLPDFLERHINAKYRNFGVELSMQFDPLHAVYLNSSAPGGHPRTGNPGNLWLFGAVAVFILLIACINFMNISTARYTSRSREVGVRKVLGADRKLLVTHFLGESIMISSFALVLALFLAEILIPAFNNLTQTSVSLFSISPLIIPVLLALVVMVGFLAGSYPAFLMSSFMPISVIKGNMISVNKGKGFRNLLVVAQFAISTVFIIATITIYLQLRFMNGKQPGFNKNSVLILSLEGENSRNGIELLKIELSKLPSVLASGASSDIPGYGLTRNGYFPEGYDNAQMIHVLDVDDDYLKTMEIGIVQGEDFSREKSLDDDAYLINRAFATNYLWQEPLGKIIRRDGDHKVIGVVDDFHFAPMHTAVAPLIITRKPESGFNYLSIRVKQGQIVPALEAVEQIWMRLFPGEPFHYFFLENHMRTAYEPEKKFGQLFLAFTILAIFLACLGIFGLAAFLAERRRKEIGVRKTFGASSGNILFWLAKEFGWLVIAGNLIAWPVAWLLMQRWLGNFAYKISLSWWIFALALAFSFFITLATVTWQSYKASRQNPVDSLRYE